MIADFSNSDMRSSRAGIAMSAPNRTLNRQPVAAQWHSATQFAFVERLSKPAIAAIGLRPQRNRHRISQKREQMNLQMRSEFQFERCNLFCKLSALDMAGAGGIEPPNGGIKIRCLTAWLRPIRSSGDGGGTGYRRFPQVVPVYRERRGISTACRGKIPQAPAWGGIALYCWAGFRRPTKAPFPDRPLPVETVPVS